MADDATSISELDVNLPDPDGLAGEGDDEIRLLKAILLATFTGEVGVDEYDATAGAGKILVGPRAINLIPSRLDDAEARLTAIETGGGLDPTPIPGGVLPIGSIIMWSGSVASIPQKYALCDGGTYDGFVTPDLRDRFIVGAGGSYTPGDSTAPGTESHTTSSSGAHTHTLTVAGRMLAENEIPNHGHAMRIETHVFSSFDNSKTGGLTISNGTPANVAANSNVPSSGAGNQIGGQGITQVEHGHPGSTADSGGAHQHTVDVRPPYYALCFIAYTGGSA